MERESGYLTFWKTGNALRDGMSELRGFVVRRRLDSAKPYSSKGPSPPVHQHFSRLLLARRQIAVNVGSPPQQLHQWIAIVSHTCQFNTVELLYFTSVLEDCLGKKSEQYFYLASPAMFPKPVPTLMISFVTLVTNLSITTETGLARFVAWYKEYHGIT